MSKARNVGQNLAELALCLAVISAVIAGMSIYVKRAMQARYKEGSNYVVSQLQATGGGEFQNIKGQYDPYYNESSYTDNFNGTRTGGYPNSSVDMTSTRTGSSSVGLPGEND